MNEKSLRVLEYYKVMEMLKSKVASSLGMREVDNLKISNSYDDVLSMQKETSEAQSILIKKGSVPLGGITEISSKAKMASIGSSLDPSSLLMVADTLRGARILKKFLSPDDETSYELIQSLSESISVFKDVEDEIFNAIISDVEISDNASVTLKNIRRQIVQKNQSIRAKLNSIISSTTYQKYLQEALITVRGDRFVIPLKQEYRSVVPGIVHDQSSSGATLFIEPMSIVQMNNDLKELKLREKEEIEKILKELSEMVGNIHDEILSNESLLSKLDFIFAKGKLSIQMKAIEPRINKDMKFEIKNGRHPLLDQNKVVPTNIYLGDKFSTLIITGPNTGGKTVTLKTVGLFSLMTQSGLHIPADFGSSMCIFNQIFSDIGDEQSIEQNLSTFSSHMSNIVKILKDVNEKSLVLFDELGAGTDPLEGAAIAMAILDDLHSLGSLTIATTHYSELKHYALTKDGVENASVEFDIKTLSPTYKLLIGVPGKSNAFEISRKLGLNDYIIDRAKKLIDSENIEFEDLLESIEKNRIETENEKAQAQALKIEIEEIKKDYNKKYEKMMSQKQKIIDDAKDKAHKIIKESKDKADEYIKQLRKLEKEGDFREQNKKIENVRREINESMKGLEKTFKNVIVPKISTKQIKNLKVGELVKVVSLNQNGTVLSVDEAKSEALVQIGIMKMTLSFATLERINQQNKPQMSSGAGKILKKKTANIKTDVDLRGMNLEEAMSEVDKYLDDAYLAGLAKVTVIHGIGTGVLKSGINQMLKKHKHVKAYRPGVYGEGGVGVTIVELK